MGAGGAGVFQRLRGVKSGLGTVGLIPIVPLVLDHVSADFRRPGQDCIPNERRPGFCAYDAVHRQTGTILVTSHSGVRLDAPDAVLRQLTAQEVQPMLKQLDVVAPVALAEQVGVGGFGLCYGRQKQGPFFLPPPYQASQHVVHMVRASTAPA